MFFRICSSQFTLTCVAALAVGSYEDAIILCSGAKATLLSCSRSLTPGNEQTCRIISYLTTHNMQATEVAALASIRTATAFSRAFWSELDATVASISNTCALRDQDLSQCAENPTL